MTGALGFVHPCFINLINKVFFGCNVFKNLYKCRLGVLLTRPSVLCYMLLHKGTTLLGHFAEQRTVGKICIKKTGSSTIMRKFSNLIISHKFLCYSCLRSYKRLFLKHGQAQEVAVSDHILITNLMH